MKIAILASAILIVAFPVLKDYYETKNSPAYDIACFEAIRAESTHLAVSDPGTLKIVDSAIFFKENGIQRVIIGNCSLYEKIPPKKTSDVKSGVKKPKKVHTQTPA